jgi:AcrR family transcriptional regulator
MSQPERQATRGRPRTITRERIADAGIAIGLPNITFIGVAAALGVSHMALYKHVASLEELKRLVAEEIFARWQIPRATDNRSSELKDYLMMFATSVGKFVAATQPMLDKIDAHQSHIAKAYGISKDQARWLLSTVAFHGMAVADTVYTVIDKESIPDVRRTIEEIDMESELTQGMHALIIGALVILETNQPNKLSSQG